MLRRKFGAILAQDPAKGVFISAVQLQLAAVRDNLAEVAKEIEAAEQARHDDLLEASLNPGGEAAARVDAADAALALLYGKRSRLQEGLSIAEDAEKTRISDRDAKDLAAKQRAMAQHLATALKDAEKLADHWATGQHLFSRYIKSAQAAAGLLPNHMNWAIEFLSAAFMRDLLAVEAYKNGERELAGLHDDRVLPTRLREYQDGRTGAIPSLVEILAKHLEGIKREYSGIKSQLASVANPASLAPLASVPVPFMTPAGKPAAEGDYSPKIQGEPEGDPNRPGSGPGVQPGGALLGVAIGLGGQIVERYAETPPEAVQHVEPVPGADVPADLTPTPTASPPITGDTIIDDPAPRALADILAEEPAR
jgi:hypothetical protein